ncbi:MAG: hypothetical protein ACLPXB_06350, partial [Thiobacillaceae bacterium]
MRCHCNTTHTLFNRKGTGHGLRWGLLATLVLAGTAGGAMAADPRGFLETIRHHVTLTSSVTDNGDLNPYAVVVAPVSAGKIA